MADDFREYIGDIYVQDQSPQGTLGSFCWAPVPYTHSTVNVVRPVVNDPAHPDFGKYTVKPVSLEAVADGRKVASAHRFPDANLKLQQGEDLFVVRGKVRPVVVLFNPRAIYDEIQKDNVKPERDVTMCFGCVPAYTLVDGEGRTNHGAAFIENVRVLKYGPYCYVPGHPSLMDREGFLRMDRLLWLPPALLKPMGLKLNSVGVSYAKSWFDWFASGAPLPDELSQVRQYFMDLLDEERKQRAAKPKS